MNCNRRDFLFGKWNTGTQSSSSKVDIAQSNTEDFALPSDFSPKMLRLEAQRLGIDINHASEQEIRQKLLEVFHRQSAPPV